VLVALRSTGTNPILSWLQQMDALRLVLGTAA